MATPHSQLKDLINLWFRQLNYKVILKLSMQLTQPICQQKMMDFKMGRA